MSFTHLPVELIENILFRLGPRDLSATAAAGSRQIQAVADADVMWRPFLPSDLPRFLTRVVGGFQFRTFKELYYRIASDQPLVLDRGDLFFSGDRNSGKNSCFVGAGLIVPKDSEHWIRCSIADESVRYSNSLMLLRSGSLEFDCRLDPHLLSDDTRYAAYLVFKIADYGYGFRSVRFSAGYSFTRNEGDMDVDVNEEVVIDGDSFYLDVGEEIGDGVNLPRRRNDTCMEVELVKFTIDHDEPYDLMITMSGDNPPMHGLVISAIEVRPLK